SVAYCLAEPSAPGLSLSENALARRTHRITGLFGMRLGDIVNGTISIVLKKTILKRSAFFAQLRSRREELTIELGFFCLTSRWRQVRPGVSRPRACAPEGTTIESVQRAASEPITSISGAQRSRGPSPSPCRSR